MENSTGNYAERCRATDKSDAADFASAFAKLPPVSTTRDKPNAAANKPNAAANKPNAADKL